MMEFLRAVTGPRCVWLHHRWLTLSSGGGGAGSLRYPAGQRQSVGSEFLPHLDEGAIWARGTLAPSTGPTEGTRVMNQARLILAAFPK